MYLWREIGANDFKIKVHCIDKFNFILSLTKSNILYQVKLQFISDIGTSFLSFFHYHTV